ncbi:copper resistance protein CopC [Azospirillum canadense]|uniref:copper resistance protein CopC n=1 Tax=Azospirillum canadense TaxID=403962 RepID=UPI00222643A0|nr:copper resistance protein CopC [Azospirillum canadense]MCW2242446.1 methionine-rich copper-binding protein CopC [Azospirillum canadense]
MTIRRVAPAALIAASVAALLPAGAGFAQSAGTATAVAAGPARSFSVRFEEPVNHAQARVELVTPESTRVLQPRLNSAPNTLFVAMGVLPAGRYQLQWAVRTASGAVERGGLPFTVAPADRPQETDGMIVSMQDTNGR